jgi:hypothetical protein
MALLPRERNGTTIVREGEPAILNFEQGQQKAPDNAGAQCESI